MNARFQFSATPVLSVNPSGRVPLSARLVAKTNLPSLLEIDISDGVRRWTIASGETMATAHAVPILDLRSARRHTVRVKARHGDDAITTDALTFETAQLPERFPQPRVLHAERGKMEPGYTVFPSRPTEEAQDSGTFGAIIAVDASGEIVWYYQPDHFVDHPRRLRNGNFIYAGPDQTLFEVDVMGNLHGKWQTVLGAARRSVDAIPVEARRVHHDIFEMPSGNILVACLEIREYPDYPTSDKDPAAPREPSKVVGDVIVEFARDGRIVNQWKLLDLLDPYRFGYGGLAKGNPRRGDTQARNWSHCNSVFYDAASDAIVLSIRRQDAIVKISRKTGQLLWILGTPANWRSPWTEKLLRPIGRLEWQYHQHDATVTPAGTILCFDNGNCRASPFDVKTPPEHSVSRAVEFVVDERAMTVRQIWSYGKEQGEALFSVYVGGAAWLPKTGNILVDYGGMVTDAAGRYVENPGDGLGHVRMLEVTHTENPEVVFDLMIDDRKGNPPRGWDAYRGMRIADLFMLSGLATQGGS
jgi:arylsulfate sulfotransferase